MAQTVYILCGLIASGKSTWATHKAQTEKDTIIICRDDMRTMIKNKYVYDKQYESTIRTMAAEGIKAALMDGLNIIIDETHLTRGKRFELLFAIDHIRQQTDIDINATVCYFPEKVKNVEYRMKNPRGMTEEQWRAIYEKMLEVFEEPTEDILPPWCDVQVIEEGQYV